MVEAQQRRSRGGGRAAETGYEASATGSRNSRIANARRNAADRPDPAPARLQQLSDAKTGGLVGGHLDPGRNHRAQSHAQLDGACSASDGRVDVATPASVRTGTAGSDVHRPNLPHRPGRHLYGPQAGRSPGALARGLDRPGQRTAIRLCAPQLAALSAWIRRRQRHRRRGGRQSQRPLAWRLRTDGAFTAAGFGIRLHGVQRVPLSGQQLPGYEHSVGRDSGQAVRLHTGVALVPVSLRSTFAETSASRPAGSTYPDGDHRRHRRRVLGDSQLSG